MAARSDHPRNVLFLLCDQLQRQVLGPYGGRVPTPSWDALAASGATFDHAYCSSPLCVPARASLMTGMWPHAHGALCFGEGHDRVRSGLPLLPDLLAQSGFAVACEGIWHIMGEDRADRYAHFHSRNFPYKEHLELFVAQGGQEGEQLGHVITYADDGEPVEWTFSVPRPAAWTRPMEEHPDWRSAAAVASFVREASADEPLALWCSLGGPHPPLLVPESYLRLFSPEEMTPPASWGENMSDLPRAVRDAPGCQAVRDWTWEQWARATAAYLGYVAFIDACFGLILHALEESGRRSETLIIAHTDHGEMLGAHNLYQKGVPYDETIRLPLVISGPGVAAGHRSQLASQVDLAPTVLDMLDLPPLPHGQGTSLRPILENPAAPGRSYAFSEFNGEIRGGAHTRTVVTERYKYAYHHHDSDQLFDREQDPHELHNLVDGEDLRPVLSELRAALCDWMAATGDSLRLEGL